ncbi:dephospho-CoA kinase [Gordonia polyisoprenivorans]|uniref:dephospho-CoA kinase n=1 Tax=Gordonia polyisoprenivorans TaxID=84595 RepID=UPI001AD6EF62|nr:dephospho-CoA kinase [Gordonia polyisoprenivorans]QTI67448.1 dephospho-CoA kinase [Gordonia polyisoprenivorans]
MIRVGLTGGIGAGKSTVAKTFIERGGFHIDADKIAREVVEPGTPGLARLVEAFGEDILAGDGSLDRAALAAKAFVDDESRSTLNSITHPLVGARTQEMLEAAPDDAIVIQDIPLLVEGNMAPFFHLVIIVHADAEERVRRLVELRGMPESDARARIAAQADDDQRRAVADAWLDNSSSPEALAAASAELWARRLVPFETNVRTRTPATVDPELVAAEPNSSTLPTRITQRLWALAGANATAIDAAASGSADQGFVITARDADASDALADALPPGGFAPIGDGRFGSADPGRPATVGIRTAG